jgi:hypothetical protein
MYLLVTRKHRFIDVLMPVYCAYQYVTLYYGLLVAFIGFNEELKIFYVLQKTFFYEIRN